MSVFSVKATISADDATSPVLAKIRKELNALASASRKFSGNKLDLGIKGIGDVSGTSRSLASLASRYQAVGVAGSAAASSISRINALLGRQTGLINQNTGAAAFTRRLGAPALPFYGRRSSVYDPFPQNIPAALSHRAAHGVVTAGRNVARAGGEGVLEGDTSRSLSRLFGLLPEQIRAVESEAFKASQKYRTQTAASLEEAGRNAISNLKNVNDFGPVMESIGKAAQAASTVFGGDAKKGADAATKYYRAADISGFGDTAQGTTKFIEAVARAQIRSGKDVNPTLIGSAFRRAGVAKYGLSSEAISDVVNLVDEFQGDTGNLLRTFNRELTSQNIAKKNRISLENAGLRRKGGGATDAELLQSDPLGWIRKVLVPELERRKVDLDNSSAVNEALRKLGFQEGSIRLASAGVTKRDEYKRFREDVKRVKYDDTTIQGIADEQIKAGLTSVSSAFKTAADRATKDIQPYISGSLGRLSKYISDSTDPKNIDATKSALGTGAALAAGGTVALLAEALKDPARAAHTAAMGIHSAALLRASVLPIPGIGPGGPGGGGALKSLGRLVAPVAVAIVANEIGSKIHEIGKNIDGRNYAPKDEDELLRIQGERNKIEKKIDEIRKNSKNKEAADVLIGPLQTSLNDYNNRINEYGMKTERILRSLPKPHEFDSGDSLFKSLYVSGEFAGKNGKLRNQKRSANDLLDSGGEKNRQNAFRGEPHEAKLASSIEQLGATVDNLSSVGEKFGISASSKLEDGSSWGSTAAAAISSGLEAVISRLSGIYIGVTGKPGASKPAGSESP